MAKVKNSGSTARNCDRRVGIDHCGVNLHFPDG